jgi:hypothetical protein
VDSTVVLKSEQKPLNIPQICCTTLLMGFINIQPLFRSQNNRNAPAGLLQKSLSPPGKNGVKDFELMDVMECQESRCPGRGVAEDRMSRKFKVFKEEIITEIGEDRRGRHCYDIDLKLRYKVLRQHEVCQSGEGKTVNLSGGGIAVAINEVLSRGSIIEMAIAWPVLLNERCALNLVITGKVVRSSAAVTAVRVQRYEFRTQAVRPLQARAAGYLA